MSNSDAEAVIVSSKFGMVSRERVHFRHAKGAENIGPSPISAVSLTTRNNPFLGAFFAFIGGLALLGAIVRLARDAETGSVITQALLGGAALAIGVMLLQGRDYIRIETTSGQIKQRNCAFWDRGEAARFVDAVQTVVFKLKTRAREGA